jgi:hypothetical protein
MGVESSRVPDNQVLEPGEWRTSDSHTQNLWSSGLMNDQINPP